MRLKTVAKLSVIVSVLLFCIAVGFYAFTRLDMTERNREVNLYSLVPADCVGVLESDNISYFLNELPSINYGKELSYFQFPGLFEFLLHNLNEYAVQNAHGLSNQMSHLMVSFHKPGNMNDQVVYFRMGATDQQLLEDMLSEYAPVNFLPKEEKYRGKTIVVYPLGRDEFLASYSGDGFLALSYQKRLIEQVIDVKLDKTSLDEDEVFKQVLAKKKSYHYLTLYARSAPMPFLDAEDKCWSEYEFHLNSDVLYLTGETFQADSSFDSSELLECIQLLDGEFENNRLISTNKDSTTVYVEQALEKMERGEQTLFNQCVTNLSKEAVFALVADMDEVVKEPEYWAAYLPSFVLEKAMLFKPFILTAQLSLNKERPSHMWVFTYKN